MGADARLTSTLPDDEQAAASAYRAAVQAFGEVANALNETRDRDTLLRLIGKHICLLAGIERCSVYLREEESGLYRGQVGWSPAWERGEEPDAQERIKRLTAGTPADAFTHEIVSGKQPVVVADTGTDPRPIQSAMRSWGIRSILGVPMVLRGEVIGIIFLDDADKPHVFTPFESEITARFAELAAVAFSQGEMTTHLRRMLHTIARQNDLLRGATRMDETLTDLVLAGASLAQIAEAVSELVGKPCEIYDAAEHRLAAAGPDGTGGESDPPALDAAVRRHATVRHALESLGTKGSGVMGPFPEAGLEHRCLYAPITSRDEVWGSLIVIERGAPFGPLDAHIARRAASNVAIELAAERRAARAEWDGRASLARALIRGSDNPDPLRRRAQYLGIDLGAPRVVCIVGARDESVLPGAAEAAEAFAARGADVLATAVAEGMLVIVPLDPDAAALTAVAAARDLVADVLARLAPEATPVAAIASRACAVADYARGYAEARQVLSCVREFSRPGHPLIVTADELGPGRLFLASSSREEAERFADDALGELLRSPDAAKGDLLHTLEVFFDSSRSVRKAAEELQVHENTIRYRLARIRELTGLAVGTSSDDELTAHVALLVLRLRRLAGDPDLIGSKARSPAPRRASGRRR